MDEQNGSHQAEGHSKHAMATHTSSKLLQGRVESGMLRAGTPLEKFQAAAKQVAVTHEVRHQLCGTPWMAVSTHLQLMLWRTACTPAIAYLLLAVARRSRCR